MTEETSIGGQICAYCGYSLAGLQSGICPECGKDLPPPSTERRVRVDRVWLALSLAGVALFATLSWSSLRLGTALGGVYTGNQELVRATIGFAAASSAYAVAAFEICVHRSKLRSVRPLTATRGIAIMVLIGIAAFVGVFLSLYL